MIELLVIGYGNPLRSDDGAGPAVAAAVAAERLAGVRTVTAHQLTPELALEVSRCRRVVFVDADVGTSAMRVLRVRDGSEGGPSISHQVRPAAILHLAESLGHAPQEALVVSLPVSNLAFGDSLSERTEIAVRQAVDVIVGMTG